MATINFGSGGNIFAQLLGSNTIQPASLLAGFSQARQEGRQNRLLALEERRFEEQSAANADQRRLDELYRQRQLQFEQRRVALAEQNAVDTRDFRQDQLQFRESVAQQNKQLADAKLQLAEDEFLLKERQIDAAIKRGDLNEEIGKENLETARLNRRKAQTLYEIETSPENLAIGRIERRAQGVESIRTGVGEGGSDRDRLDIFNTIVGDDAAGAGLGGFSRIGESIQDQQRRQLQSRDTIDPSLATDPDFRFFEHNGTGTRNLPDLTQPFLLNPQSSTNGLFQSDQRIREEAFSLLDRIRGGINDEFLNEDQFSFSRTGSLV